MHTVMIIINRLVIGGMAINSLEVIRALHADYRILLVTGSKDEDEVELKFGSKGLAGCELIRIPGLQRSINPVNDIRAFLSLKSLIRARKPEILHTIGAKPGFVGRLAAKLSGVPVIIHAYHGHVFHGYFSPLLSRLLIMLERLAASWTTKIISVSKKQVDELSGVYRIASKEKMIYIPIGIDHEKFHDETGAKRNAFRKRYLLEDDEIAIGIVGRIVPIKNHSFLLKVAARTYRSGLKIRYFVIGDGEKLRQKLELEAKFLALDCTYFPRLPQKAYVTFTSWLDEMDAAMAGLDIIALTSKNEGTPLSIIEAGLMAKPVIATNVGAVDEVMLPGVSGFATERNDLEQFTNQLLSLVRDPALCKSMGEQGKLYTSNRYSIEAQVDATRRLYNELLASLPPLKSQLPQS